MGILHKWKRHDSIRIKREREGKVNGIEFRRHKERGRPAEGEKKLWTSIRRKSRWHGKVNELLAASRDFGGATANVFVTTMAHNNIHMAFVVAVRRAKCGRGTRRLLWFVLWPPSTTSCVFLRMKGAAAGIYSNRRANGRAS